MLSLGIITYQLNHLKTEQLIFSLKNRYCIKVFALPFLQRPVRSVILQHRPNPLIAAHPKELCIRYGLEYYPIMRDDEIENGCDYYIVAGAGILSKECLKGKRVLNGHPGIIPLVKGLDAFKWCIYDMLPLGITLHYIDENVDEGEVISTFETPIFLSDSLESLARRHYENEIRILSDFERYLLKPQFAYDKVLQGERRWRMRKDKESELYRRFELYKNKYACNSI